MSLVRRCDRCKKVTDNFESIDDLPDNWQYIRLEVRGSAGNVTGTEERAICDECAEQLYRWFHYDEAGNRRG